MDRARATRTGAATPFRPTAHRWLSAILALGLTVAGCGGGAPPDGAGDGGPGGAPTRRPVTGDLSGMLPTQVGGETLTVASGSGTKGLDLLPSADIESITQQLEKLGLTPDRLDIAVAGDVEAANDESGVAVIAVRVPGVLFTPGSGPQVSFVKSLLGVTGTTRTARATVARKTAATVKESGDTPRTIYIFGPTEVIFIGLGSRELVEEAFTDIPERP